MNTSYKAMGALAGGIALGLMLGYAIFDQKKKENIFAPTFTSEEQATTRLNTWLTENGGNGAFGIQKLQDGPWVIVQEN